MFIVLLVSDALFSYFLVSIKMFSGLLFDYELCLDVSEILRTESWFFFLTGVLIMVVAYQVDNHVGKYSMVRTGLFFLFAASLAGVVYAMVNFKGDIEKEAMKLLSKIMTLLYVSTSPARNVLLLEQIRIPSEAKKIRKYAYFLIYFRVLGRGILRIFYESSGTLNTHLIASSFVVFGYYTFFTCCIAELLFFEPFRPRIWSKIISCFVYAFYRAMNNKERKPVPRPKPIAMKKSGERRKSRAEPMQMERRTSASSKLDFLPIGGEKEQPKSQSRTKTLKFLRKFVLPWSRERYSQNVVQEVMIKEELSHWLCWSRLGFSEFEVRQTVYFYRIFPFIVFGVGFSLMVYTNKCLTVLQGELVNRHADYIEEFDILSLFIFFDICLFPIVEHWLFPALSKKIGRDVYFVMMGFFLISIAFCVILYIQIRLKSLPYVPRTNFAQIRVFNAQNDSVTLTDKVAKKKYYVEPYNYYLIKDIQVQNGMTKRYGVSSEKTNKKIDIELHGNTTRNVLVSSFGIQNVLPKDASVFYSIKDPVSSSYFAVLTPPLNECVFIFESQDFRTKQKFLRDNLYIIEPGNYEINILVNSTSVSVAKIGFENIQKGALYSFFVYKTRNELFAKLFHLEGPIPISYVHLVPQIFLTSFGKALATVSYFRFLFLESPHKLRCTVFSFLLALQTETIAINFYGNLIERVFSSSIFFTFAVAGFNIFIFLVFLYAGAKFPHRFKPY